MTDSKKKRGSPDNKTIDVNDPNEVRNWTKSMNTTPAKLKEAVKEVGKSAAKVRAYLKK